MNTDECVGAARCYSLRRLLWLCARDFSSGHQRSVGLGLRGDFVTPSWKILGKLLISTGVDLQVFKAVFKTFLLPSTERFPDHTVAALAVSCHVVW